MWGWRLGRRLQHSERDGRLHILSFVRAVEVLNSDLSPFPPLPQPLCLAESTLVTTYVSQNMSNVCRG